MPVDYRLQRRKSAISPTRLRAERIEDMGRVDGTAALFVLTRVGLHLFHVDCIVTSAGAATVRALRQRRWEAQKCENCEAPTHGIHVLCDDCRADRRGYWPRYAQKRRERKQRQRAARSAA